MMPIAARKGLTAIILVLALSIPSFAAKDAPLPPPAGIEDARQRIRFLRESLETVEAWVEWNWGTEFDRSNPELSRAPEKGANETPEAFKERQMKVRMATSDVKSRLRSDRKEWLAKEWDRALAAEIEEPLAVKLGPYDGDRKLFPLLLGFGWPSGLSVNLRIPERERAAFEAQFPATLPATFRVNEQGEVQLLSIEKRWDTDVQEVFVAPPGPRLAWQGAHASWVTAVAVRADGSQVLSAGADGLIECRDAESGNPLFQLAKVEMALALAYSPDGMTFATGGADSALRVRSATDGREIWKVQQKGMIMAVAYSPDGRYIATGDDAGFLRIRNAETGEERFKAAAGMPVRAVDFTKGGRGIVVGGEGEHVLLWDMGTERFAWRKKIEWPAYAVAASPSGGLVVVGGGGKELLMLREADGTELWNAKTEGEVRAVRFDPSGRLLAAGGAGYTARVFPASGGDSVWSAQIGNPIRSLAFGVDGRKLFVGSADGGLRMFNIDEGDRVQAAFGTPGRIYVERKRVETLFR
jgi:hypothetical protein